MTAVEAHNPPVTTEPVQPPSNAPVWQGYADLIEKVMPAVVSVTTERGVSQNLVGGQPEFEGKPEEFRRFFGEGPESEMFKRFMERFFEGSPEQFGMPHGPQMPMMGAGTGFIFHDDGHIAMLLERVAVVSRSLAATGAACVSAAIATVAASRPG